MNLRHRELTSPSIDYSARARVARGLRVRGRLRFGRTMCRRLACSSRRTQRL